MILGIDTSNYTTSLALLDQAGHLKADKRKLLKVESGKKGLRQSKALFQHINNLPNLFKQIAGVKDKIEKIVVSSKPRPNEDSYMPVFKAGVSQAESLAHVLGVELIKTSHQEGHIKAGLWSTGVDLTDFLVLHISGGTTELLEAEAAQTGFKLRVLNQPIDISAGQFIDRIGVKLGLDFPAGPQLEKLAQKASKPVKLPVAVDGYRLSFSGPCSAAMRKLKDKDAELNRAELALGVQEVIYQSLAKLLKQAVKDEALKQILIVGGVASNQYLRQNLRANLKEYDGAIKLYFAQPEYSTDNAVGTAGLGLK